MLVTLNINDLICFLPWTTSSFFSFLFFFLLIALLYCCQRCFHSILNTMVSFCTWSLKIKMKVQYLTLQTHLIISVTVVLSCNMFVTMTFNQIFYLDQMKYDLLYHTNQRECMVVLSLFLDYVVYKVKSLEFKFSSLDHLIE